MPMRLLPASLRRFTSSQRAAAAVEFALVGLAFFTFIMILLNLGMLGLTVGSLERGVQAAARTAAVTAAGNYFSSSPQQYTCPNASTVAGYFNNTLGGVLPTAGTSSSANPSLTVNWYNNSAGTTYSGKPPGVLVVVTATETWSPLGFAMLIPALKLKMTTMATVDGTAGSSSIDTTSCDIHS